ncbi:hypothetical protein GCM10009555_052530 [Acrocarpospora macrocephala]|uniref:Uncharacterized protein n=1 Tax=Acrocarpospora macrocephala TaxID=150177 RepID=A0A5M3X2I7_9ACTN|nr:hypothetical protein [Acrocarpospora macrocephala]GES15957.1 hypothetical protein Amac_095550 [Acrocarpospora macrocephala]
MLTLAGRADREDLGYQALLGVINIGVGSRFHDRALEALRVAATRATGRVGDTARDYLETLP